MARTKTRRVTSDQETERAMLSYLMVNDDGQVLDSLEDRDFVHHEHGYLLEQMKALRAKGQPHNDSVALLRRMRADPKCPDDPALMLTRLAQCAKDYSIGSQGDFYLKCLRVDRVRRGIYAACERVMKIADNFPHEPEKALEAAERYVHGLQEKLPK